VVAGVGAGAGAALAMMAVMALLRFSVQLPTLPELMLSPILSLMGGEAFSAALDRLYYAGRPLLFTIILEGMLLVGALLGLLYAWLARPHGSGRGLSNSAWGGVVYGLIIGVLLNVAFLPLLGQPPFADRPVGVYTESPVPLWVGIMLLALVYGVTLYALLPKPATMGAGAGDEGTPATQGVDRRQALRIIGGTVLAVLGGLVFWAGGTVLNQGGLTSPVDRTAAGSSPPQDTAGPQGPATSGTAQATSTPEPPASTRTPEPIPTQTAQPTAEPTGVGASSASPTPQAAAQAPTNTPPPTNTPIPVPVIKVQEITPTESFYHVSKNFFDPNPSADGWKLRIKGLVDNPYELTYQQLTALPAVNVVVGMMCISNPIGGGLIGSTTWKGVRLADLLKRARPRQGVVDVALYALDDYSDSISYQKAMDPNVVLAWEMGGQRLNATHGFPARLLVPGIYGMKHVKWLTTIELVDYDFKGYWQQPSQGWSDPAPVHTMSRIDFPTERTLPLQKHSISGIAFAGDRSISKVEVSTDGGKTWHEAYLKPPLSRTAWVLWGYDWTPPKPGKYTVMVRATDGQGKLQIATRTDPYPNGATGYHAVTYTIRG
jgi:DMSO/TMAO reductase YedYZ molybdopterin-dependent catalytic subunit